MNIFKKKIILASKSPRRKELLTAGGFDFEVRTNSVEEIYPDDLLPMDVAPYLAEKKANAAIGFIKDQEIILAADSIVILNEKIYEKPLDEAEAISMLQELSGNVHTVVTGVCLLSPHKKKVFSGVSKVTMEPLSLAEIQYYVKNYQPYDKAGAYGIQEWIGLCKISKIEGTYTNVKGLPMDLVYLHLKEF